MCIIIFNIDYNYFLEMFKENSAMIISLYLVRNCFPLYWAKNIECIALVLSLRKQNKILKKFVLSSFPLKNFLKYSLAL